MPDFDHTSILCKIDLLKRNGKKIVLANGCFDLLHIGHIEYLEGAKGLGDTLIVGVNSDASVFLHKHRPPLIKEMDRVKLISALRCVDFVFLFGKPTFEHYINAIKPHVYAAGVDKAGQDNREMYACKNNGIEIRYIGKEKKYSSSLLAERFHERFKN